MRQIKFYRTGQEYGHFSNFAAYPIELSGKRWPTTEHYFQAMKFNDESDQEEIRKANSPMMAARAGRDKKRTVRSDWDTVKVEAMKVATTAKFTQHAELRDLLLATGDAEIIEHTSNDRYWADGGDGSGQNMLGQILMEVREALRKDFVAAEETVS